QFGAQGANSRVGGAGDGEGGGGQTVLQSFNTRAEGPAPKPVGRGVRREHGNRSGTRANAAFRGGWLARATPGRTAAGAPRRAARRRPGEGSSRRRGKVTAIRRRRGKFSKGGAGRRGTDRHGAAVSQSMPRDASWPRMDARS